MPHWQCSVCLVFQCSTLSADVCINSKAVMFSCFMSSFHDVAVSLSINVLITFPHTIYISLSLSIPSPCTAARLSSQWPKCFLLWLLLHNVGLYLPKRHWMSQLPAYKGRGRPAHPLFPPYFCYYRCKGLNRGLPMCFFSLISTGILAPASIFHLLQSGFLLSISLSNLKTRIKCTLRRK